MTFKKNIKNNVAGIEFILKLKPVSYTHDYAAYEKHSGFSIEKDTLMDESTKKAWKELQKKNEKIVYTGFLAQEVEEAAGSLGYDGRN